MDRTADFSNSHVLPVAAGSGEWLLVAAVVVILLGVAMGLFTRAGSEISDHPRSSEMDETAGSAADAQQDDGGLHGEEGQRFPSSRGTR